MLGVFVRYCAHLDVLAMHDPAFRAWMSSRNRSLRAEKRRLDLFLALNRLHLLAISLKKRSIQLRLFVLKTPDYLSAFLVTIFRSHAP
jgi:hypothetical protein